MSIKRLAKTGVSLLSGQGILVTTQLILPPLFLQHYGTNLYGQWLALSAAASYLGTLNFGIHNFANNHATIAYNRGDTDEVNVIQATAFSLIVCLALVAATLASIVFFCPISRWLHLTNMTQLAAATTIYLLGLQLLIRLVFGFQQTAFLVIGAYHRGSNWLNLLQIVTLIGTSILVLSGVQFFWIAASQAITTAAFTILVSIDLYYNASVAFPRFRYVSLDRVMDIVRPTSYYGMIFAATFLVYQLPLVIMLPIVGPTAVVVFATTRTIYSMSRQVLTSLSSALGPEITDLFGRQNWSSLLKLYDLSERGVFALVPVVTLSTFLATPALVAIWLHKPDLFQLKLCLMMALISAALGIKEHKYQFQISINHHTEMARFMFFAYIAMVACMVPIVHLFGIIGFLLLWLIAEIAQVLYIVKLNQKLFRHVSPLEMQPLLKVALVTGLGSFICERIVIHLPTSSIVTQLVVPVLFGAALLVIEYPIFRLGALRYLITSRFLRRPDKELNPAA